MVDIVPKEKYFLVDNCCLCMDSLQHQRRFLEFALAMPALSRLITVAPSESERERKYHEGYFSALQLLLSSSWLTLQSLDVRHVIFPLSHLLDVPLVNLKELTIYSDATTE